MILQCEECSARYLVPRDAIGADGRRVRCSHCGHEWFEPPPEDDDDDAAAFDDDADDTAFGADIADKDHDAEIDPIPESVRPLPEESDVPALRDGGARSDEMADLRRWTGYGAAAAVFFIVLGGLLVAHKPVTDLWPGMGAFYSLFGMERTVAAESLVFERVQAQKGRTGEGIEVIRVGGNILNLSRTEQALPVLQARLMDRDNDVLDAWQVTIDQTTIEPEGEALLFTVYPDAPETATQLNLRFLAP